MYGRAPKNKTVSFRLSAVEYQRFHQVCIERGAPSISDLARTALENLAASGSGQRPDPLFAEIRDLRGRIHALEVELDRISADAEARKAKAGA